MSNVALGDLIELKYGKALKDADRSGGSFPVVGSGGVVGWHDRGFTVGPTIVVGRKGSIGSVTWVDGSAWPIDTTYFVEVRSQDVDKKWLYRLLLSLPLAAMNKSAAVPGLVRDDVYRLKVTLPSLGEQRHAIALLEQASTVLTKRRQAVSQLESLIGVLFTSTFGRQDEWASRWPMGTIADLATEVSYGTSSRAGDAGEWPVLRMGNLTDDGRLDLADLKYLDLARPEIARYSLRRGDLLFNRTNSREKVGKSAVVRTDRALVFAGYLVRVRFANSAVSEFVAAHLNSPYGRAVRQAMAKSAVNQANINAREMQSIQIPLPTADALNTFAAKREAVEAERELVLRALAADQELFSSLQHRAFTEQL